MGRRSQTEAEIDEAFFAKVIRHGESPGGCWYWRGATANSSSSNGGGYGRFRHALVHRWAYGRFQGEIPPGYQVDHLCEVRWCVNPAHLEAVPQWVNLSRLHRRAALRGQECPYGRFRHCWVCDVYGPFGVPPRVQLRRGGAVEDRWMPTLRDFSSASAFGAACDAWRSDLVAVSRGQLEE